MTDVAERAGVSVSTVSRTLRGLPTVSSSARARVEEAVRELSFVVSRQASSLVTGRTGNIAVLTHSLDSWFMSTAIGAVGSVLRDAGLDMQVYCVPDVEQRAAFFERLPARRNADALLVVSFDLTEEEGARLDELDVPVVYISQHAPGRASVYVDDVAGTRRGTQHLLNLGHRRIGYVAAETDWGFAFSADARLTGYRQAVAGAGLPLDEDLVVAARCERRPVEEAVGRLLGLADPPTAVVAESDQLAMRVMWVLRAAGIGVPERMSVLGFDDHEFAEWMDLTTIAQSPEDLGRAAAELACELLRDGTPDQARHIELPTRLLPRGSTAAVTRTAARGEEGAGE